MTTPTNRPAATVDVNTVTYDAERGEVTLDSGWAPYAQGSVTLSYNDVTDVEDINPRNGDRADVAAALQDATNRDFDLGIRSRVIDYQARTCTLTLASDEALLQDYARLTDDRDILWNVQGSLRDMIDAVLDAAIPGASLNAAPTTDADMTSYWNVTNLHPNPVPASSANYGLGANAGTLGFSGGSVTWLSTSTNLSNLIAAGSLTAFRVTPGKTYTFAFMHSAFTGTQQQAAIQWRNNGGATALATAFGATTIANSGFYQRSTVTATAPVGAEFMYPLILTGLNAVGTAHAVREVIVYEGDRLIPFFSGATTDTATYQYDWADTTAPNASSSTRTALVDTAQPDAFVWDTGVTAWDVLQPFITRAELRLFCDESRVWRLVDNTYAVPGVVAVNDGNATQANDTISREDANLWADGVVVTYTSTIAGDTSTMTDTAGMAGKVLIVNYDRPYPGPGAAAAILQSIQTRGRQQDVVALTDYTTTPGMTSQITLTDDLLEGVVKSVTWDMTRGTMALGSKLLGIVPPHSWLSLAVGYSWNDIPPGDDWSTL